MAFDLSIKVKVGVGFGSLYKEAWPCQKSNHTYALSTWHVCKWDCREQQQAMLPWVSILYCQYEGDLTSHSHNVLYNNLQEYGYRFVCVCRIYWWEIQQPQNCHTTHARIWGTLQWVTAWGKSLITMGRILQMSTGKQKWESRWISVLIYALIFTGVDWWKLSQEKSYYIGWLIGFT
jgi:hypothetical protein